MLLAIALLLRIEKRWWAGEVPETHLDLLLEVCKATTDSSSAIELLLLSTRKPGGLVVDLAEDLLDALAEGTSPQICKVASQVAHAELGGLLRLYRTIQKQRTEEIHE